MLYYIATSYTHKDEHVRQLRYELVTHYAAKLMEMGLHVFSPITHCHPIAEIGNLPKDFGYWSDYCHKTLDMCDAIIVFKQSGWKESKGLTAEIAYAKEKKIPIFYSE